MQKELNNFQISLKENTVNENNRYFVSSMKQESNSNTVCNGEVFSVYEKALQQTHFSVNTVFKRY